MIRFIIGGVSSNREELFSDEIKRSVKQGREAVVIIPDQFSFEYDKKLYDKLGAIGFNKLTTAGFNRLSELIQTQFGGGNGTRNAEDNAKIILMYRAVRALRKSGDISFYTKLADKKGLEKGNFISQLIKLVQQMRESGITPQAAQAASEKLTGTLSQKMHDISRIYAQYMTQLEEAGLHDSVSNIMSAVRSARENGYFKHKDVYIDAFSSFTYDEIKMLELCFSHADNVTISFVIDSDSVKQGIHPFRLPQTTLAVLERMAHDQGYEIINASESELYSKDIVFVSKNLFNVTKHLFNETSDNVRVLNADDAYSEADFVCAQIKHLNLQGYKYSDIAIILRDIQQDSSVFESTLEKFDIPYFIDSPDRVSSSSLVHYFTLLFSCITSRHYKTDSILKLVKSPFFSSEKSNANKLEEYCLKWNIDGDMWIKDYFGLDITLIDNDSVRKHIDSIEVIRKQIIDPFEKFRAQCSGADISAEKMCEAFFGLLNEIHLSARAYSVVRRASQSGNTTQIELSRGLRQLWNSILSAVKSIYDCLGEDTISVRQFYELFRVMVSQMKVSNPPQKMDCIRIADASHSRLSNIKAAFICHVNDGVFPKSITSTGLLSRNDLSVLCDTFENILGDFSKSFSGDVRYTLMKEELCCYNAVSTPTQKLYLTYINADLTGEEKLPSSLIKNVLNCFENKCDEKISEIPLEFFCTSEKAAFHTAVEHFRDPGTSVEAIKMSLNGTQYASKLAGMDMSSEKLAQSVKSSLDKELSTKAFFTDDTAVISASQIDTYYKCPFGYFCKYGLKLSPVQSMDMSAIHKGNLVHKVLETIFSVRDTEGEFLILNDCAETDDEIKKLIDKCFDSYYKTEFNLDFGKSQRFIYDYNSLRNLSYTIVKYVQAELIKSKYKPYSTEYKFGKDTADRIIRFETDGGRVIKVTGYIDRVDKSDSGDTEYIRIIDYKTGKIELEKANLYCGLNLQMLVYLDAFLKSEKDGKTKVPAGIEYMSFGGSVENFTDSSIPQSQYHAKEIQNTLEAYKPKGMFSSSDDVLDTFSGTSNSYTPFGSKGKGVVPPKEFDAIRKFAQHKIADFGNALENGKFPMNAVGNVCSYCDYRTVCGKEKYEDTSGIEHNKNELVSRFDAAIQKIIEANAGGDEE